MDKIIGYAPFGVPIYSNNIKSKAGKVEHTPYGIKYQCVELVRRWYATVFGFVFEDIPNAVDIFNLRHATSMKTGMKCPFIRVFNRGFDLPKFGDILIWKDSGAYETTGHVAIVAHISQNGVKIAEQNGSENGYRNLTIAQNRVYDPDGTILGWMRLGL